MTTLTPTAAPSTAMASSPPSARQRARESAYGYPRNFLGHRFVYVVVSPRARGLSIGVNLNPDRFCNFDCIYCEVNRSTPPTAHELDVDLMAEELVQTLDVIHGQQLRTLPLYRSLPPELLVLKHVTLSGDGEPTLCPKFVEAVHAVIHVRAIGRFPAFKIVLVTNGSGLDRPEVQAGLKYLTAGDEIWIKLEVGSQDWMNQINRPQVPLEKILENILLVSRHRPVIIQSLFTSINGAEPPPAEIERFVQRLADLKAAGAKISTVQIYSATRPTPHSECGHLPLRTLSQIAQLVRRNAHLHAEVF